MGIYFNSRQDKLFKLHPGRQKTNISDVLKNMEKTLKYIGRICAARGIMINRHVTPRDQE
jgi:hypothetical protein